MRGSHCQHAHVALYGGLSRSTCVVVQETPRQRHAWINDLIHRAVIRAEIPATKEPQSVSRDDGKRPDGLTLVPWQSGRSATWDVTVVHTLAVSYVSRSALHAGSAAAAAAETKSAKYWRESTRPLKFFCKSLPLYLMLDQRKLVLWMKIAHSGNIVLRTISILNNNEFVAVSSK